MDHINEGFCINCSKQFKGKIGLSIHQRYMHAADCYQRVTDDITSIRANYVRPIWTDLESKRLSMVEISIITKKPDSKRFPINKQIMQQFQGKTVTAIKTHRASSKCKELVRTLLTNDDVLKSNTTNTLSTYTNILCDLEVTSSTAHDLNITSPPTHHLNNIYLLHIT